MNIVHELNQLDYGGAERIVRNIIKYDTNNKHSVLAYKDGAFRKEIEAVGAQVIIPEENKEVEFDADIIHIHSGGGISNIALNLGKNFTFIETIHSPVRSAMTAEFIKRRVGVTQTVTDMNENCETILNGIDLDDVVITKEKELVRKELGISEDAIVIGRLGRLGKDKGLEDWLLTCYGLQKQGFDFVPVIVGGEASGLNGTYLGKLKLMAASLPVKNVVWVGHTTDIHTYLQIMDIFLYPSPTEGFGLVFMEALMNQCTVVTYETKVTKELLAGYAILTKQSIEDLISGTKKAFNVNYRDAYAGIGADLVRSEYSAKRMSLQYQELYERCNRDFNGQN